MRLMTPDKWLPPPARLELARDDVHVWRAALDLSAPVLSAFERTLSPDELRRAARFRFPQLRQRFVAGRGILRAILSRYLDTSPGELAFGYSGYGKPFLHARPGQAALHFNLSHADGMALYAIAHDRAVGVDVEHFHRSIDHLQIAEHCFSATELRALHALPPELQPRAFLAGWTRKEAYIKARGAGLSLPLDQFSVSLAPGEPAQLLLVEHDPAEASRWALRDLRPGPGYVGALAACGQRWGLACWQWSE